jgi:hypothetical protein
LEIKAVNQLEKEAGYRYLAVAAVLLAGGTFSLNKSKK